MRGRAAIFRALLLLSVVMVGAPLTAHVGTLTTVYEGTAGPYPIRVIVRPPGVVPGLAEITVRTRTPGVTRVRVKPVKSDAGEAVTPWSDEALPVSGDADLRAATMWLMGTGSYSVYVDVDGPRGHARGVVPIVSVATKRLPMSPAVSWLLLACCGLLMAGIASIAGAWRREATLPSGAVADAPRRRRARLAMAVAFVAAMLFVALGWLWWNAVDNAYRKVLFQPPRVSTSVAAGTLELQIDDPSLPPLLPDHGKLMHLFLIQESGRPAFAHLHPLRAGRDRFRAALPPLPAGAYRLFADITDESGFSQTLVGRVQLPATSSQAPTDADDSWQFPPSPSRFTFENRQPIRANEDVDLRFSVNGTPAPHIEPYMGMMGHAAVVADDGSVFVHLHPMGTISMATQTAAPTHSMAAMAWAPGTNTISFPFTFPKAGHYRIWVQTRVAGQVVTGAFEETVR
jgi:hypothetical protein